MKTRIEYDHKSSPVKTKECQFATKARAEYWFDKLDKLGYGVMRIERRVKFFR